jgi:hypothetical protein
MQFVDDRTAEQKKTHQFIVLMTDTFMSNWGRVRNGSSFAGWACRYEDHRQVEQWVRSRSDSKRVRIVGGSYRPKSNACAHCHIYVVNPGHPALS